MRLRELFEQSGLDQQTLAQATGITPAFLSMVINGKKSMTLDTYAAFCDRLGVRMDWLYGTSVYPKYSETILGWQRHLRSRLAQESVPGNKNPGQRIALCVNMIQGLEPGALPPWFLSLHIGVRAGTIEALMRNEVAASDFVIYRAADLFGVPRVWFSTGDSEDPAPPDASAYASVIDSMRLQGLTPERVSANLDVLARLVQNATT